MRSLDSIASSISRVEARITNVLDSAVSTVDKDVEHPSSEPDTYSRLSSPLRASWAVLDDESDLPKATFARSSPPTKPRMFNNELEVGLRYGLSC